MKLTKAFQQIAMTSILVGLNSFVLAGPIINFTPRSKSEPKPVVKTDANVAAKVESKAVQETKKSPKLAANTNSKSKQNGKNDDKAPPAALGDKPPPYANPDRIILQGSFIYWQADSEGFEIGTSEALLATSTGTPDNILNVSDDMKERNMHFDWDPGFKVGVGAVFGRKDQWELLLNWTWLQSKGDAHNTGVEGIASAGIIFLDPTTEGVLADQNALAPEWVTANPVAQLNYPASNAFHTTGSWRMHYDTLDLEFGRNFFLARSLTLRAHAGLRAAWIHQNTKVTYDLNSLESLSIGGGISAVNEYDTTVFKGNNEYDGVGLRGGLDLNWNFINSFCLFAKASGSILYGFYDVEESVVTTGTQVTTTGMTVTNSPFTFNSSFSNKFHKTRTNLQAALGLMWHTGFSRDRTHLFVSASYEVNEWFQQNELRTITGNAVQAFSVANGKNGDLGLHGVTVDLRFDF